MSSWFQRVAERATAGAVQGLFPAPAPVPSLDDPFERVVYDTPDYPRQESRTAPMASSVPAAITPAVQPDPLSPPPPVEPPPSAAQRVEKSRLPTEPPVTSAQAITISQSDSDAPARMLPSEPVSTQPLIIRETRTIEPADQMAEPRVEQPEARTFEVRTTERIVEVRNIAPERQGTTPAPMPPEQQRERAAALQPVVAPPEFTAPRPADEPKLVIGRLRVDVVSPPEPETSPKVPRTRGRRSASLSPALRPMPPRPFGLRQS